MSTPARALGGEARIISLVGAAHFMSHVYQFSIYPLMISITAGLNITYLELGVAMTLFSLATALGQIPMGFVVDRIGGRTVLIGGLIVQAGAITLIGLTSSYWALLALFTLAGLAHTVYHPADYAILSQSIARERLGKAFSLHTVTGTTGTAATAYLMTGLAALYDWRAAFVIIGLFGLLVAAGLMTQGGVLEGHPEEAAARRRKAAEPGQIKDGLRLLMSVHMLMFFMFYVILTTGFSGVRGFTAPALVEMYGITEAQAAGPLTGFTIGIPIGVLLGGIIADRIGPRVISAVVGLVTSAALLALISQVTMPLFLVIAAITGAGIMRGTIQATRDLLTHAVTPDGAHGKVFGFVSSGSHAGQAAMPLAFGWILDNTSPEWIFLIAAVMALVALVTFIGISGTVNARSGRAT